jgi:hypothetical protein
MQESVSTAMNSDRDEPSSAIDARDNRRWLIGVGISLVFGLFSVVMALLSYSTRAKPSGPPATNASPTPGAAAEPARREKARGDRRADPIVTPRRER